MCKCSYTCEPVSVYVRVHLSHIDKNFSSTQVPMYAYLFCSFFSTRTFCIILQLHYQLSYGVLMSF